MTTANPTGMIGSFLRKICSPSHFVEFVYFRNKARKDRAEKRTLKEQNPFNDTSEGFLRRAYNSTEAYLAHQARREIPTAREMEDAYPVRLAYFTKHHGNTVDPEADRGKSVLCLGSRDGAEVEAFRHFGMLAIGMDISFQDQNKFVHYGDFHDIPYPDRCFDYVYLNTLNHALHPDRVIAEARRVLKLATGVLLADLRFGVSEGAPMEGRWQTVAWEKQSDMVDLIEGIGFKLLKKTDLEDKPFVRHRFQIT